MHIHEKCIARSRSIYNQAKDSITEHCLCHARKKKRKSRLGGDPMSVVTLVFPQRSFTENLNFAALVSFFFLLCLLASPPAVILAGIIDSIWARLTISGGSRIMASRIIRNVDSSLQLRSQSEPVAHWFILYKTYSRVKIMANQHIEEARVQRFSLINHAFGIIFMYT